MIGGVCGGGSGAWAAGSCRWGEGGCAYIVSKKGGRGAVERGLGFGHEFYTSCKDQLVVREEADVVWLEVA